MSPPEKNLHQLVDHLFRHEAGRRAAILTRLFGLHNLELAEDVVQDTLHQALKDWSFGQQLPDNPAAYTMDQAFLETEITDSQLRMIFTCCHPDLPTEAHVALTLKTLCGFNIAEIAAALLTTEPNIHKRLDRAKDKIRNQSIA